MAVRVLDQTHWAKAEPFAEALDQLSPLDQQIVLELLTVRHCLRMGAPQKHFVARSMHKHVTQILAGPKE